ncbi:MAG: Eco57I restriction-modification methylase domain-containing protein [Akkermansiaceae bacterium]|nr:Eco57I restriction-modification methylase domain-containing protein [Akkermansiaceae bacterium]
MNDAWFRRLFQQPFDPEKWTAVLRDFFRASELRSTPEPLEKNDETAEGYYLGRIDTEEPYSIGLFRYEIRKGSVLHKRAGLRALVKPYLKWNFDAALAVFDDGERWRLSFICDIKGEGEKTPPTRFTYVFGDPECRCSTAVERFGLLREQGISFRSLRDAFSVEALTEQFYKELFKWYSWALEEKSGVSFPETPGESLEVKLIRLITRLMFVWFIRQKGLVPGRLFDAGWLKGVLKGFGPRSESSGVYYNAILQNLFFATLNRAAAGGEGGGRGFAKADGADSKTLYRYAEMFSLPEDEVIGLFSGVPFLNGGLFECLDKAETAGGAERACSYDGFSRNGRRRARVPDRLFFAAERGLFSILSRYNFTIEENSPHEQQVALDPELLGKVFENLLGTYNPETRETARSQSGSFYTPREIVSFMVDESLKEYLKGRLGELPEGLLDGLFSDAFEEEKEKPGRKEDCERVYEALKSVRVLDPACGSGAFPMGLLNRMADVMRKIRPEEKMYDLKLRLIEDCIYGCDIQSIAVQISKLRFFISLICDCEPDAAKPNLGITPLPNLETKFVAADALAPLGRNWAAGAPGQLYFDTKAAEDAEEELDRVRHQYFTAKTPSEKKELRMEDRRQRQKLIELQLLADPSRDRARRLAEWNPYDQNAVAPFFDLQWMFGLGGFDIVIGNPPYIQLSNNGGGLGKKYGDFGYETFDKRGDIYCLFYERGLRLLKEGGCLCFITSNKWMRAGYGEKLRAFLAGHDPRLLVDFAGVKVFKSATVDTNVLLCAKAENRHKTLCAVAGGRKEGGFDLRKLSLFARRHGAECAFRGGEGWVVLSPVEQRIREKIEKAGKPLKDWDIRINYGIKTGCNEAFIISTKRREEILADCGDEAERSRTAALIRPILRGRDIKRYSCEWAGLWLIATFPAKHYDIEMYPAVERHLLSFARDGLIRSGNGWVAKNHLDDFCRQKLLQEGKFVLIDGKYILNAQGQREKGRKKTSNKWFETQDSISYWEDFERPKIIYSDIATSISFQVVEKSIFLTNTAYFISSDNLEILRYIHCILNSKLMSWYYRTISVQLGEKAVRMFSIYILRIPIPPLPSVLNENFFNSSDTIYALYGLTPEEIRTIENLYN